MLSLSGCFKREPSDDIFAFRLPAVVQFNSSMELVINSKVGSFLAPELEEKLFTDVNVGDLIYTVFSVNVSLPQSPSGHFTAYNISWAKVYTKSAIATEGGASETGDYNFPIKDIAILEFWNNYAYFAIEHNAPSGQLFTYEMTYDINETGNVPTVYLRAKKTGDEISGNNERIAMFFAFDITELELKFKNSDNILYINIMIKTGVDSDGNEVFSNFIYNPVFFVFDD